MNLFNNKCLLFGFFCVFYTISADAQLSGTVSSVKSTGRKVIVPLVLTNGFAEQIESARAVCFLFDDQGKVVGQDSEWVIGGIRGTTGLAAGATTRFNLVISARKPFTSTNLNAKVQFTRVVLEGGKLADLTHDIVIKPEARQP